MTLLLLPVLLASIGPTSTPLDAGRFSVEIVFDELSPKGHFNAQMALVRKAREICGAASKAVSEGSLELNNAEPIRAKKRAMHLREVYSCKPI